MNKDHPVYIIVRLIPKGKVVTYGQIATLCHIRSPRFVGFALHQNPDPQTIPCHRVVNARGKLASQFAFGGLMGQKKKLEQDGVVVKNYAVELAQYRWNPNNK